MDTEDINTQTESSIINNENHKEELTYFHVSEKKLIIMGVFTVGLYELYWFYRNWSHVRFKMGSKIMPVWRSIFAIIYSFFLFKKIKNDISNDKSIINERRCEKILGKLP